MAKYTFCLQRHIKSLSILSGKPSTYLNSRQLPFHPCCIIEVLPQDHHHCCIENNIHRAADKFCIPSNTLFLVGEPDEMASLHSFMAGVHNNWHRFINVHTNVCFFLIQHARSLQ